MILQDKNGLQFHVHGYDREAGIVYVSRRAPPGDAAAMRLATLKALGYAPMTGDHNGREAVLRERQDG